MNVDVKVLVEQCVLPSQLECQDAFGFSLNYFTGDYKPINASVTLFATVPMSLPADPVSGISTAHQRFCYDETDNIWNVETLFGQLEVGSWFPLVGDKAEVLTD